MIFLLLLALCSCSSYKFGDGGLASKYETLSVPFVQGDWDGDLTSALIEQIARSGVYHYQKEGGAVILNVKVTNIWDENIGYRYYRNKEDRLKREIIPTETRINSTAEVSLVESATNAIVLGPVRLTASVDFDHDYYTMRDATNVFSLGQLNDFDSAYDAVYRPLNRALAQKIVDFINDSW